MKYFFSFAISFFWVSFFSGIRRIARISFFILQSLLFQLFQIFNLLTNILSVLGTIDLFLKRGNLSVYLGNFIQFIFLFYQIIDKRIELLVGGIYLLRHLTLLFGNLSQNTFYTEHSAGVCITIVILQGFENSVRIFTCLGHCLHGIHHILDLRFGIVFRQSFSQLVKQIKLFRRVFGNSVRILFFSHIQGYLCLYLSNQIFISLLDIAEPSFFVDVLLDNLRIFFFELLKSFFIVLGTLLCFLEFSEEIFRFGLFLGTSFIELFSNLFCFPLLLNQLHNSTHHRTDGHNDGTPWSGGKSGFELLLGQCGRTSGTRQPRFCGGKQKYNRFVCLANRHILQRKSMSLLLGGIHRFLGQQQSSVCAGQCNHQSLMLCHKFHNFFGNLQTGSSCLGNLCYYRHQFLSKSRFGILNRFLGFIQLGSGVAVDGSGLVDDRISIAIGFGGQLLGISEFVGIVGQCHQGLLDAGSFQFQIGKSFSQCRRTIGSGDFIKGVKNCKKSGIHIAVNQPFELISSHAYQIGIFLHLAHHVHHDFLDGGGRFFHLRHILVHSRSNAHNMSLRDAGSVGHTCQACREIHNVGFRCRR